jgi:heat shock protein beta
MKTKVEKVRDEPMTEEEIAIAEEQEEKERQEKEARGETVEEPSEPVERLKKVPYDDWEFKQVNNKKPIWLDEPGDKGDDEYVELYRQVTGVYDKPAVWAHFKAEGDINFRSIIFIRHLQKGSQNKDSVKDQAKTRINL